MSDFVKFEMSPRLLGSVAGTYTESYRVFMEFVDNSIDSAEDFFDRDLQKYEKTIKINVTIVGTSKTSGKVIISDNCTGMDEKGILRIVESIGNSEKKQGAFTNGQFGFGIYSFLAICGQTQIISSKTKNSALHIVLDEKELNKDRLEDVKIKNPEEYTGTDHNFDSSGTTVVLSKFKKWNKNEYEKLIDDIENHFEGLLDRENIEIKIINKSKQKEYVCQPIDYDKYDGDTFIDEPEELQYFDKKYKAQNIFPLSSNTYIKAFIKITKGEVINKPVVILNKGRKISEIHDLKSFKSPNKQAIWNHQNLTGYIEIDGFLEPTISRNDFQKKGQNKNALYGYIEGIEKDILGLIELVNEARQESHYQNLENELNKILSKLAKADTIAMNYRSDIISGSDIALQEGSDGLDLSGEGGKDHGELSGKGEGNIGEGEGDGIGPGNEAGDLPGGDSSSGDQFSKEEDPFSENLNAGKKNRKSGFNIKITNQEPNKIINQKTQQEELQRSSLIDDTIYIYRQHPDFLERIKTTRAGKKHKITQRLVTYLAGEMTVHYKDKFHNKQGQPDYGKWMFQDLTDSIYYIEKGLSGLVDLNLNTLGSDDE